MVENTPLATRIQNDSLYSTANATKEKSDSLSGTSPNPYNAQLMSTNYDSVMTPSVSKNQK